MLGVCIGVDGAKGGWVAVELREGVDAAFARARAFRTFAELVAAYPEAAVIAVDIPIGQRDPAARAAGDAAARAMVGPRRSSVFPTPARAVLAGGGLRHSKKTPEGYEQRRALLASQGIVIRDDLRLPRVGRDDMLDAAAAAWSARRIAAGTTFALRGDGRQGEVERIPAIWY